MSISPVFLCQSYAILSLKVRKTACLVTFIFTQMKHTKTAIDLKSNIELRSVLRFLWVSFNQNRHTIKILYPNVCIIISNPYYIPLPIRSWFTFKVSETRRPIFTLKSKCFSNADKRHFRIRTYTYI